MPSCPARLAAALFLCGTAICPAPGFAASLVEISGFRTLADRFGFIVIYPSATCSGNCFDVSSPQALRRDGGSDPVGIRSMITHVVQSDGADANRVYVTGASSGAMMTNVLLGVYPEVFKASAAFNNGTIGASGNQQFGFQVRRPTGNTQVPAAYTCTSA
jgi:poly(hydroxyalkanoate) depolymerase family esterase